MEPAPIRVPDTIEPIQGFRVWRFSLRGDRAILWPVSGHPYGGWPGAEKRWVFARCDLAARLRPFGLDHAAPDEDCSCGFYAMASLADRLPAINMADRSRVPTIGHVVGRVLLAGKVIEHERGYRAERARIAELIPERGFEHATIAVAVRLGLPISESVCHSRPASPFRSSPSSRSS